MTSRLAAQARAGPARKWPRSTRPSPPPTKAFGGRLRRGSNQGNGIMEFFKIKRTVPFMRHAKLFNIISLITFVLAIFFLATKGLHFSIEFTGGTVMEVTYKAEAKPDLIRKALNDIGLTDISVTKFGTSHDVLIRLPLKTAQGANQNVEMQKQADAVMKALQGQ